ncbi:hypothetical protein [Parasutterella muris]|uniref:Uncharacterized protein n=1 Tax=Parasutterella muris TaxID=2565572 RepID=A0A6L6YGL7_9BURK|nr:hypothetical protein [Parasutterella muris]MVX56766.1 hypothetical protein [Parasutterella muris]
MYLNERSRMLEAALIAINILKTNFGASAFNTILEGVKNGAIKDPVKTAEDLKNAAEVLGVELKPANQEAIRQISEAMDNFYQHRTQYSRVSPQSSAEDIANESASHPRKSQPTDDKDSDLNSPEIQNP